MKSLLEYYKTEIGDKLQKARKSVDLEGKGKKKKKQQENAGQGSWKIVEMCQKKPSESVSEEFENN